VDLAILREERAMQIFDDKKEKIGILSEFKDREITTTLDSGDKELSFSYSATGVLVDLLKEEYYIRTKTDEFVIKAVEKGEQFNKYTATLNVEELEGMPFRYGFKTEEQTIKECLEIAFNGTGWHIGKCNVTKKRTIDMQESATAWDVLQKCLSTYRCECIIHSLTKTIDIYDRIGSDKGCYFMEGMNLRKISLKSDTYDFYTRIYPIGKDGITPECLIGKDYIDNFQYSSKVKSYVWKDERYTNATSLIEDATAKIEEMSRPYKAYTAEVIDLAKASEKYKDILLYGIGDTVTLVSKKMRTKEKQRIVKITEYPETPEKNTVEISNAKKTFAEIQQEENDLLKDNIYEESQKREDEDKKVIVRIEKTEEKIETEVTDRQNENRELSSKISQTAQKIETEVTDRQNENRELSSKISQTAHKIELTATGGDKTIGIVIRLYDENGNIIDTTSGDANITITGFVTFSDLANAGRTTINGANITTGTINCDRLDGGTIRGQKIIVDNGWDLLKDTSGNNIYSILNSWKRTNSLASKGNENDWYGTQRFYTDISAPCIKGRTSSAAANVRCQDGTNGWLATSATSSKRYKHAITDITDEKLNPQRLYDLPVRQFVYNDDYLDENDQRYGMTVCGFIAEEVEEKYPVACEYNDDNMPENWDIRYIVPPMLKLIQQQHEEIEKIKSDNREILDKFRKLETQMEKAQEINTERR
jgi:phage minor structural protein